ncbi:hypothetical protein NPIL_478011 [Nephila pilipes]|uniref:Uncharacterized protein n=1 Tax=Nephila pilipes TaxID=299642 RepID=A0A8X6U698_NEPPI|nr:hypothetical protein NPIL_478011 [Nephila pilipes]
MMAPIVINGVVCERMIGQLNRRWLLRLPVIAHRIKVIRHLVPSSSVTSLEERGNNLTFSCYDTEASQIASVLKEENPSHRSLIE